jgi:predicted aspartyl protease
MKYSFGELPIVFVRVTGLNGKKAELKAVVSTGATECIISTKDATMLGYRFNYNLQERSTEGTKEVVTAGFLVDMPPIVLKEVTLGELSATDVKAWVYDVPEMAGIDVVLGASFLKHFNLSFDFKNGFFEIGA